MNYICRQSAFEEHKKFSESSVRIRARVRKYDRALVNRFEGLKVAGSSQFAVNTERRCQFAFFAMESQNGAYVANWSISLKV